MQVTYLTKEGTFVHAQVLTNSELVQACLEEGDNIVIPLPLVSERWLCRILDDCNLQGLKLDEWCEFFDVAKYLGHEPLMDALAAFFVEVTCDKTPEELCELVPNKTLDCDALLQNTVWRITPILNKQPQPQENILLVLLLGDDVDPVAARFVNKHTQGFLCLRDIGPDDAVRTGNTKLVRAMIRTKEDDFDLVHANLAAQNGHLDIIRDLREHGIHCNHQGANLAAWYGHLDVVRDLRAYRIHCNSHGADMAAWYGRLDVVRDLRAHGVHCTVDGVMLAAEGGRLDVVRDLREHGVHCTVDGANWAARYGHLNVVRDLRAHGDHCTVDGAIMAAINGHLEVIRDLRAHGVHCTSNGANLTAGYGHLEVIRDLRAHGIHCTARGANMAARYGRLDVVRDLRAHGIHCTARGANMAAWYGHFDVVRDLREHGIHCNNDGANFSGEN